MRLDEAFRSGEYTPKILNALREMVLPPVTIMEVCGTHTMAIARSGLRQFLPGNVRLISGPGCPVCVTTEGEIDEILRIAMEPGVIIATYGDLVRVPGSTPGDNLQKRRALGADVRIVYSPMDALEIAAQHPSKSVIFLGVGFETTAPGTALAVREADIRGLHNFFLLCLLKQTEPALRALTAREDFCVDGFICPGHVASIIGADAFRFLPEEKGLAAVVAGFETQDVAFAVYKLLLQLRDQRPALENEYIRAVSAGGNAAAMTMIHSVLQDADASWRGLGNIPGSGYQLREAYRAHDAAARFDFHADTCRHRSPCRCGDVICGTAEPGDCPLFGTDCTPDDPVGPCMVSGEGACAAAYHYGRWL